MYPAPNTGDLGSVPAILSTAAGFLDDIPIIGGLFKKGGECPPTLPGMVSSRCLNRKQHNFMVNSEKWHTTQLPEGLPTPRLMRLSHEHETPPLSPEVPFHKWLNWNDPRIPQQVRDTLQFILQHNRAPAAGEIALTRAPEPGVPTPALAGMTLPLLLGGGLLVAMLVRK